MRANVRARAVVTVLARVVWRGGMLFANRAGSARMVKSLDVGVPRLESGMPVGGELGYADELTLACAVEARSSL